MPWPLSQDYNEAIQNPQTCFGDPELRRPRRSPTPWACPCRAPATSPTSTRSSCPASKKWAVKCFTRQIPGLHERYQQISRHLAEVKLPFMVDFTYLEQGIRSRGDWYPILKMQWVEGLTLNEFVKDNAGQAASPGDALPDLGEAGQASARGGHGPLRPAARQRPAGAGRQGGLAGVCG